MAIFFCVRKLNVEDGMEELIQLLKDTFSDRLKQVILSNSKDKEKISKVKIRPVLLKDKLVFQESAYIGTKVFHENYSAKDMMEKTTEYMSETFKQAEIETLDFKAVVLVSKKGKMTVKKQMLKTKDNAPVALEHNREKQYVLKADKPIDFLVDLGVQSKDGKINKSRYDKFKQKRC